MYLYTRIIHIGKFKGANRKMKGKKANVILNNKNLCHYLNTYGKQYQCNGKFVEIQMADVAMRDE